VIRINLRAEPHVVDSTLDRDASKPIMTSYTAAPPI